MIARIELRNWLCFRGEYVVELGPGPWAVVARHDLDPRRSNASGKTALLQAVAFAATGLLERTDVRDADGWITRGEKDGSVRLVLEDGTWIERSKRRGKPRQVRASILGRAEAAQDAASAALLRHLRFGAEDFARSVFAAQGQMAAVLRADPRERLEMVSAWLELGAGERAEERAAEIAAEASREVDALVAKRSAIDPGGEPEESVAALEERAAAKRAALTRVNARREAKAARERARSAAEERDRVVTRGKAIRAEVALLEHRGVEAAADAADELVAAATAKLDAATRVVDERRVVASGKFDGACPVAGIDCPATATINAGRVAASSRLKAALQRAEEARGELSAARAASITIREERADLAAKRRELEELRERLRRLPPVDDALTRVNADDDAEVDEDEVLRELVDAEANLRSALEHRSRREKAAAEVARLNEALREASAKLDAAAAARAVFKRAVRSVAEQALGAIEVGACEAIASAGVDLTVAARWSREGKGPAKSCERCGAPFPASARAKSCERCGAERGLLQVQRLDLELSDSSGAYDDLAGIAWQLAASDWLLARRGSPWATAVLDEPAGAFDRTTRAGFVRCLASLMGRGSLRQALVVAHSDDVLDALPRRVVVRVSASGERRIEVA